MNGIFIVFFHAGFRGRHVQARHDLWCCRSSRRPFARVCFHCSCYLPRGGWLVAALMRTISEADLAQRYRWLAGTAVVAGLGVWTTHFGAMLGYRPDMVLGFVHDHHHSLGRWSPSWSWAAAGPGEALSVLAYPDPGWRGRRVRYRRDASRRHGSARGMPADPFAGHDKTFWPQVSVLAVSRWFVACRDAWRRLGWSALFSPWQSPVLTSSRLPARRWCHHRAIAACRTKISCSAS